MKHLSILVIPSVFMFFRSVTMFQLAEEINGEEFTAEEWLKMAEVSWDDLDDEVEDVEDDSPGRVGWSDEFSMRNGPAGNEKDITLDVYYESMCPYSRKYITNQVEPACSRLKDYVQVNFYPYGNAIAKTTKDGSMEVHCQHGPNECIGNKIHACGLERLQTNQKKIGYISCVMKTPDPKIGGKNCSELYGLNWGEIESCSEGAEGDDLHYRYGVDTTSLNPPNKGVPTTAINKSRGSDEYQRRMKQDLFGVLCQRLKEMSVRPKECGYGSWTRRT